MITGIIVWLVTGALSGWLASLILRTPSQRGIVIQIAAGIVGALILGLVLGRANMGRGFPFESFLWSLIGAIVVLAAVNLIFRSKLR